MDCLTPKSENQCTQGIISDFRGGKLIHLEEKQKQTTTNYKQAPTPTIQNNNNEDSLTNKFGELAIDRNSTLTTNECMNQLFI